MKRLSANSWSCLLVWCLCMCLIIIAFTSSCSRKEKLVEVEPGKSIGGVGLGMLENQVVSILGTPKSRLSVEDMKKSGSFFSLSPKGEFEKKLETENESIAGLLIYKNPLLWILIGQDRRVDKLGLSDCKNVLVKGYPFLKFRYLTEDELNRLGKPSSQIRVKRTEQKMMSGEPAGTVYECYDYLYDKLGIGLTLVFDRTRQQKSKYYIFVNSIDVYVPD